MGYTGPVTRCGSRVVWPNIFYVFTFLSPTHFVSVFWFKGLELSSCVFSTTPSLLNCFNFHGISPADLRAPHSKVELSFYAPRLSGGRRPIFALHDMGHR